jgi:hypothetical protein
VSFQQGREEPYDERGYIMSFLFGWIARGFLDDDSERDYDRERDYGGGEEAGCIFGLVIFVVMCLSYFIIFR